ncbi:MAG: ATP-dependent zinc metalloprotease FtsH [Oscillospiraceae bacterium]|nr:ATP-dependent zinc metalloprotease FtsH [Oscillospiraceae bacterium]
MMRGKTPEKPQYDEIVKIFEEGNVAKFTLNFSSGELQYSTFKEIAETDLYNELHPPKMKWDKPHTVPVHKFPVPHVEIFYEKIMPIVDEINAREGQVPIQYDMVKAGAGTVLLSWLPNLVIIGVAIVAAILIFRNMNRSMNSETDRSIAFGKARTRKGKDEKRKTTFADVAGADEEKEELTEIVEFLKSPERFNAIGARIPKGVLLVGPPGTGKTLLARAVAGEAGVPFLSISGSDFVEMYVGVGASRVRDLFEQAKHDAPSIIFIDEIDAVGRHRGAGMGGGHDEREQTLNQLLVEMDGFGANEGVIIIAATNRPDILDPALLRPGRFDRQVTVGYPDIIGREAILQVHAKDKPLGPDVVLKVIAQGTVGFTGADLENLLNEAALLAARRDKKAITMAEIDEASIKVQLGTEKRSHKLSDKEKRLTAYHESGHAVASYYLDSADAVHQVSIIPRGMAGGYTLHLPSEDKDSLSKGEMLEELVVLLGGRAAEAIVLDDISTGASNDLQRATDLTRKMITKYGMSEALGPLTFGSDSGDVFLGRDYTNHTRDYSERIASEIDAEMNAIITRAYDQTTELLTAHRDKLDAVASALLEREKIDGEAFRALMVD